MMEKINDDRFSHISSDPRFRSTPKSVRKIKIDKRFQSMFTDKRFQLKYKVDKRGKPIDQSAHENLRKYYEPSSGEESSDSEGNKDETIVQEVHDEIQTENVVDDDLMNVSSSEIIKKSNKNILGSTKKGVCKENKWVVSDLDDDSSKFSQNSNKSDSKPANVRLNKNAANGFKVSDQKHEKVNNKNLRKDLDSDLIEKARMTDEIKMKLRDPNIDYARGVGTLISDSSSEESSSDSESEDELVHGWGELDRDAETTDEASSRLAVLHMDWDRIRAVDLMVLFNSFLPPEGVIKSVTVYPSEFGLERLKEEEEKGPKELVNIKADNPLDLDDESKDGQKYHMERLREYQLNRLKYYYAVVEFDSIDTANKVYSECDGLEYESSATKLDLRFVPEEEKFGQEPREVCTEMPDPSKYEPRIFTNTALQQGKVELTWDETDPDRLEFTKKIHKKADTIDTSDLKAYLASSSGEEDDHDSDNKPTKEDSDSEQEHNMKEEDKILQYKNLLASLEEEEERKKNRDIDLEITWGVGLKEKAEKSIKEKLNAPKTPFEEMLEKKKQKKLLKKREKLKRKDKGSESESNLSDDDIPSDIDLNDPYFKEELQGSKISRKKKKAIDQEETDETKQKQAELELLLLEENNNEKERSHFNMKQIEEQESAKNKKKRRKQLKKKPKEVLPEKDDFQVDVEDDRFGALFTSHHFNIDPAEPNFRKTKAMEAIINEKLKRRKLDEQDSSFGEQNSKDPELSLLVKSVKNKTTKK